ncbi:hypothetical protein CSW53_26250 (plasmid) [Rhodococcus ruber]|nr:hypothetical protein CSW53_26250 [Rhodococcus ruber]
MEFGFSVGVHVTQGFLLTRRWWCVSGLGISNTVGSVRGRWASRCPTGGAGTVVVDGVDAVGACVTSVVLGVACFSTGASVEDVVGGAVVLLFDVGVGMVVGCAEAIPSPAAIMVAISATASRLFFGAFRLGRG